MNTLNLVPPTRQRKEYFDGAFITLEGPDGSGKTTNVDYLAEQFRALGFEVVLSREPGGTPVGEKIREVILNNPMNAVTELLLFAASRAEHIETKIKPAMREGKIVISDRFSDSTFAYQGMGRGYQGLVNHLENLVQGSFEPDCTLYFDLTLEESLKRLGRRTEKSDRFDQEELKFRQAVFDGYRTRYETHIERMVKIDAMVSPEQVRNQIRAWANGGFTYWYTVGRHNKRELEWAREQQAKE